MKSGIYTITNTRSGKLYVGSAVDIAKRLGKHRAMLEKGSHPNGHLMAAWRKDGADAFSFDPIIMCKDVDLLFYEQRAIDIFDAVNSGYNIAPKAGSQLGFKMNSEAVEKIRAANLGRKQTQSHIDKKSAALRGKFRSQETKDRMALAQTGKKMSPEARAKMSAREYSPELRAKMGAANKGRVMSAETRAKMSASGKARRERERQKHIEI